MKTRKYQLFLSVFFSYFLDQSGTFSGSTPGQLSLLFSKKSVALGSAHHILQNFILCCFIVHKISRAQGHILFVGHRRGFRKLFGLSSLVLSQASLLGRWPAGFLSNWSEVQQFGSLQNRKPSLLVAFEVKSSITALREARKMQVPSVCGVSSGVSNVDAFDYHFHTNTRNDRSFFFFSFVLLSIVHDKNPA